MERHELEKLIEDAMARLGYQVLYEKLGEGRGGSYRLGEDKKVIIDSALPRDERLSILVDTIRDMDTSGIFLPPMLRKIIGEKSSDDDWK